METRSAALSDTAWVETASAKESIADFRNLKKYTAKPKGQTDTHKALLKCIFFLKIAQAKTSPLHINRGISVGGSVWRIWVGLQTVNALTIAGAQE